jgi:hypothetical protein
MARPMSPTVRKALTTYEAAISEGLSPRAALAAARAAVGDAWTPSVAASLSRYLRQHGVPRPGSGGDHRRVQEHG